MARLLRKRELWVNSAVSECLAAHILERCFLWKPPMPHLSHILTKEHTLSLKSAISLQAANWEVWIPGCYSTSIQRMLHLYIWGRWREQLSNSRGRSRTSKWEIESLCCPDGEILNYYGRMPAGEGRTRWLGLFMEQLELLLNHCYCSLSERRP